MSAFTDSEIEYLGSQGMGRLATVGPDGQPHVVPLTYNFNADEDAIDVGGVNFGETKKWRDAQANPRVTFLLDDVLRDPRRARALEVRGRAEAHDTGGSGINPRPYNKIYGGAPGAFGPSDVSGKDHREHVSWSRGTR